MDSFTAKQQQINQHKSEITRRYPEMWQALIDEWKQPGSGDAAWLMYSANYLFHTNGIRWAIDPLTLNRRVPDAPRMNLVEDLKDLSFILLTHSHKDHLDLPLLTEMKDLPVRWIVPEFLLPLTAEAGLNEKRLIVPMACEPVEIDGVRITVFDGLHWEHLPGGEVRGVPALGCLAEFNGKRWLIPGDTRSYDASQLPSFGALDGVFAHLWLGRGLALQKEPLLLEAFCRFFLACDTPRIIVTHLEEFGRDANDYWDVYHFQLAAQRFAEISPDVQVTCARMGDKIEL